MATNEPVSSPSQQMSQDPTDRRAPQEHPTGEVGLPDTRLARKNAESFSGRLPHGRIGFKLQAADDVASVIGYPHATHRTRAEPETRVKDARRARFPPRPSQGSTSLHEPTGPPLNVFVCDCSGYAI
ncbi:hypothetical protein CCHR01_03619 [Colletotrichum chrysophilum]|uniref:Uncharacterized protein n=1 Tax=Colletotrichum chrysophilum TaxID=1836956 RepID=A0AAD9ER83_9PEZI|nr:hypothetical protein CCHR01_03619 [Colletotrichum chrysophilum]